MRFLAFYILFAFSLGLHLHASDEKPPKNDCLRIYSGNLSPGETDTTPPTLRIPKDRITPQSSIRILGLDPRVETILVREGISTVGQLIVNMEELTEVRGFDETALKNIRQCMSRTGAEVAGTIQIRHPRDFVVQPDDVRKEMDLRALLLNSSEASTVSPGTASELDMALPLSEDFVRRLKFQAARFKVDVSQVVELIYFHTLNKLRVPDDQDTALIQRVAATDFQQAAALKPRHFNISSNLRRALDGDAKDYRMDPALFRLIMLRSGLEILEKTPD